MGKDPGSMRRLVLGDYPLLEPAFVRGVKAVKEDDPLSPLLILVSSKLLGLHLRRLLVESGVAHLNLRFWTLEEFSREVSTPILLKQKKTELPPYANKLIIGHIAKTQAEKDEHFYFRDIADRQGFHQAILSTLRDLKDACLSPEEMERLLGDPKVAKEVHLSKIKDVLRLWRAYEQRLSDLGWYDESDLMRSASLWIKDSPFLKQTPKILIYGFYDFNTIQKRLLRACFEAKETVLFLPYESTRAFEFVKSTLRWLEEMGFKKEAREAPSSNMPRNSLDHLCRHLFSDGKPVEGSPDAVQVLSAPGEAREVREVIRETLQATQKEGIAFHEIGILLRSPQDYSRLFREAFDGLGINPYLREGQPLVETQAGRSLLLLLNIVQRNFSRQSVMDFVTFARLHQDRFPVLGGRLFSPSQWDAFSVQAGIVEGEEEWEERLSRLQGSWSKGRETDEEGGKRPSLKEDVAAIGQLIKFVKDLFKSLRQLLDRNTWNGKVAALLDVFEAFVEQDEEGLRIRQTVRRLAELDALSIQPSQAEFIQMVEGTLKDEITPIGRFQRNGPSVVNLMAARGVSFKMVIIPGLVEKSFPPLIRQDAILLDHERGILNRVLSGKESEPLHLKARGRLDEERFLFRLAVGAPKERLILSFPRLEIGTGRERLPSSFLLAVVKAFKGKNVDFQELERFPGFVHLPLSEIAVKDPEKALDDLEFDISIGQKMVEEQKPGVMLYLRQISPFFGRGLQIESSRWGKRVFTRFDGILSSAEARRVLEERYSILQKTISPTRLEQYATCPYRYLLGVIMGLEAYVEPEREGTISPLDKGKLIHDILWKFFTKLKRERGSLVRLKLEDGDRLEAIAKKEFIEFEKTGVTGYAVLWEAEKREILDDLVSFFSEEMEETKFIPTYFEVRYGMEKLDQQESEISTKEPVSLKLAGKTVCLKGRIDRIDISRDGKIARVIDYKSGKVFGKENDFQGGKTLQLPFYLYAARQRLASLHKEIQVERAEYYYLKSQKRVGFDSQALEEKEGELREILKTIAAGIEDGIFIAVPDKQCDYCDFKLVCGGLSKILFNRKKGDSKVKRYLEMQRGEREELETSEE